jgi:copper chaperone CopZ
VETLTLDLPTMYGDHHVVEVRRLLSELPGISDVYASSSFQVVELQFDRNQVTPETITAKLEEAGYLGDLAIPVERGAKPLAEADEKPFFRHTAALAQVQEVVGFAQQVPYSGRPLWPCPGMGTLARTDEELTYG